MIAWLSKWRATRRARRFRSGYNYAWHELVMGRCETDDLEAHALSPFTFPPDDFDMGIMEAVRDWRREEGVNKELAEGAEEFFLKE